MSDRFLEFVNNNLVRDNDDKAYYEDLNVLENYVSHEFRQTILELLRVNTIFIKNYRKPKNIDVNSLPTIVMGNISKVTFDSPLMLDDVSFTIDRTSEADLLDLEMSVALKYFPNVNVVFNFECHNYDDHILFMLRLFSDDFSYVFDDHLSYQDLLENIEYAFVELSKDKYRYE